MNKTATVKPELENFRLAPQSIEAEESVIGSVLIDPSVFPCLARIICPQDFYTVKNGWIWDAVRALFNRNYPIDFLTITDELEKRGQLAEVGGSAYVSYLINVVPTAMHAEGYARIIKTTAIRRKLLDIASAAAEHAYDEDGDILVAFEKIQDTITKTRMESAARLNGAVKLISASDIMCAEYTDPYFAVPGLLPAGLCFLSGKPKLGKSWLAMQVACAVASGGKIFDQDPKPGRVLYLALEDTPRRLNTRMKKQMWPAGIPVDFITMENFDQEVGDLTKGGGDRLAHHIEHGKYRLVIIDTFAKSMGQFMRSGDQNDSSIITRALAPLQRMAMMQNCVVMVVDHQSKASSVNAQPDAVTDIIGSVSKGGVLDTSWGLYRERGKFGAKLQVIGRDIDEDKLLMVSFDRELGIWKMEGDAHDIDMTNRKQEILDALKELCRAREVEIADFVSQPRSNTHNRLADLVTEGKLRRIQEDNKVFYELREL